MTARNDITGDELKSRTNSEAYRNNYDAIFGKKTRKDTSQSTQATTRERTTAEGEQGSSKEV